MKKYSKVDIVFVDMDNTIAENRTCQNVRYYKGLYEEKRPIKVVIKAIEALYMSTGIPVVIISKAVGGRKGAEEKLRWVEKNLRLRKGSECIFLTEKEPSIKKARIIREYCNKHKIKLSNTLIIDDNKKTLQACEKIGIQAKYPQQVICDYEAMSYNFHII